MKTTLSQNKDRCHAKAGGNRNNRSAKVLCIGVSAFSLCSVGCLVCSKSACHWGRRSTFIQKSCVQTCAHTHTLLILFLQKTLKVINISFTFKWSKKIKWLDYSLPLATDKMWPAALSLCMSSLPIQTMSSNCKQNKSFPH